MSADFPRFHLSKLGALLESRNRSIRNEAVFALSQILGSPTSGHQAIAQLFSLVVQYAQSSNWEGRVAAAELFNALLVEASKNFGPEVARPDASLDLQSLSECLQTIDALSVREVLDTYRTLVSCEEPPTTSSANASAPLNSRQQRQLVDQYLEMDSSRGVSSRTFISDEELSCNNTNSQTFQYLGDNVKMELKRELEDTSLDNGAKGPFVKREAEMDEKQQENDSDNFRFLHSQIVDTLARRHFLINLVHPKWNHRHGAALAVTKLCVHANTWLLPSPIALSNIAVCLLQLMILDRFNDFVTGSSAVAPAAAQALSALLLSLCGRKTEEKDGEQSLLLRQAIASAILRKIGELLEMAEEKNWQCRQTALLVLKYHFAVSEFNLDAEQTLFDATIRSVASDPVDEVISAATQSLCSLFANPNVDERTMKRPLIDRVMDSAWTLMDSPQRMAQFREGVDSVLVDLLGLVAFWLRVSPCAQQQLSDARLQLVVSLLDCAQHSPTRAARALECICEALERRNLQASENGGEREDGKMTTTTMLTNWSDQSLFFLLKQLYRCVLFTPPSAPPTILTQCQQALSTLLCIVERRSIGPTREGGEEYGVFFNLLEQSIGVWLCCLVYDHRVTEIDVFLHHLDGPNSSRESARELFCGDDLRFLNATQCDEVLVERKVLAAQFLAPLFHVLFHVRSANSADEHTQGQQKFATQIQLLFVPYLRSNSLYQKFGAALVANAWAVYQHTKSRHGCDDDVGLTIVDENGENASTRIPHILLQEIAHWLYAAASATKLYDEVSLMVNALSTECNEFQLYCVRKGVPRNELISLPHANSMEDVILATFQSCEQRLGRTDDRQALTARHKIIVEQIARTKLAIRTYTNRITALFASTIFHFSNGGDVPLPAQLTPLIKPLVDALDSEISRPLVESLLAPAFVTLLRSTARREPSVGSAKIMPMEFPRAREPSAEFGSIGIGWTTTIGAMFTLLCRAFVDDIEENCAELVNGQCCSLEALRGLRMDAPVTDKEMEALLLQLDVLRIIFPFLHPPALRRRVIRDRIAPGIQNLFTLLASGNPAIRFRVARFLSDIASAELCSVLKLCYEHLSLGPLSNSASARCGAVELLARLVSIGAPKLLGVISLLAPIALRAISDQIEEVRNAAAFAFRQLITLLPLENRSNHFLAELADPADGNLPLANAYRDSFSLVDVLCAPSNLPRIGADQIPWLNTELRPYQSEGITWLSFLHRFGLNGILADDMGLGKTIQVLSLLAWEFGQQTHISEQQKGSTSPSAAAPSSLSLSSYAPASLIVCPRTLIDHWCNEWRTHFPHTSVRICKLSEFKSAAVQQQQQVLVMTILVISYEELKANRQFFLSDVRRWNYLVLDEGHCIRNPNSQLFEVCCSVRAVHRLILSGTPVQNSPADLWALFHFLMPGYLSTRAVFHAKFMRHILACRNARATEQQCQDGEQALQLLHRQCLPFVMRRLKTEVLAELPEKIVQDQQCELSDLQMELYQLVVDNCAIGQQRNSNSASDRTHLISPLQTLHTLRKLVDHPSLVGADLISRICAGNDDMTTKKCQRIMENMKILDVEQSGKMVAFRELLIQCQIGDRTSSTTTAALASVASAGEGDADDASNDQKSSTFAVPLPVAPPAMIIGGAHRALVFCQWRATLELIIHFLGRGAFGSDINWLRLDSTVPAKDRQNVVDRFNTDPSIDLLLLTTHIGGVGLNLTGADVAIDRAHRLGQKRTVNVYRLITRGTVEEKVMRLQRFKSETANALIGADNRSLAGMATDELLELFSLSSDDDSAGGKQRREQPKAKRPRTDADDTIAGGQWALEELWTAADDDDDEKTEQYIQTHSISAFLQATAK
uniref:Helicase ATP-binding domain-containing protein n=1 Tax=Globodera rostochiensis TaxID=31243 RepID=A0A914I3V4_GLORO